MEAGTLSGGDTGAGAVGRAAAPPKIPGFLRERGAAAQDGGASGARADQAKPRERRVLGLRVSALVEVAVFLLAALVVDLLFFGGTRFAENGIHPFWIIVILISVQYGTGEGLLAAGLASAGLLIGNIPEQTLLQDTYQYLFSICALPLSWFVTALVLGEIRMRHVRERDRLRLDLEAAAEREAKLANSCAGLASVKDRLEARVAGQLNTAVTMYQAARDLEKLEPAEVLHGMVDVVRAVLKPEKFSIYLLEDNQLEIAVHEGWNRNDEFSRTLGPGSPLFRAAIGGQRFLCCANREDEIVLAQEGVLAGPLMNTDTGEISGLLKIEKLGFVNLNFSNVRTFKVLCEWIASAYSNALLFERARSESVLNTKTRLLSYGYFKQHTAHLKELAMRLGFDLSMLIIRLDNEQELPPDTRSRVPGIMGEAVRAVLRKTDLVFEHQRSGYEYAIVLPSTPVANAQIVADKILGYLGDRSKVDLGDARFLSSVHAIHREDANQKVLNWGIVPKQLEFFTHLAERVGFDLCEVEIRPVRVEDLTPESRGRVHAVVCRVLESGLRPGQALAFSRSASCVFRLLLFGLSGEAAHSCADGLSAMIARILQEEKIAARMTFSVQAVHLERHREREYERR